MARNKANKELQYHIIAGILNKWRQQALITPDEYKYLLQALDEKNPSKYSVLWTVLA